MSARDGHLGDIAAALVDGALDGDSRDRALAHITGCIECRAEVDQQRQLKERLRRSIDPSPPAGLTDRLRALGNPDVAGARTLVPATGQQLPAVITGKPRTPDRVAGRRPAGTGRPSPGPTRAQRSRRSRSRRLRRVTAGAGVVAVGMVAALTLGPLRDQQPAVSPPVGRYTVEHARTTGGVPGVDPGAGAVMTVSGSR